MTLKNARHERFARALAEGKSQVDAFEEAGFRRHRGNASALAARPIITARVAAIQDEQRSMMRDAVEKAVDALAIDREWVLARLKENALIAAATKDFGPSNRALELLGNAISPGMFATKHVLAGDADNPLAPVTRVELVAPKADDPS